MRITEALSVRRHRAGYSHSTPKGFSLVEVLLASVLLGISAAGISTLLISGMKENELSAKYILAGNLAQDLIDEIMAKPFYDPETPENFTPGPDGGESSRAQLDNVDDYHGLSESAGALLLPDGSTLDSPRLADFSRTATAQYVTLAGQDPAADPAFILLSVQVLDGSTPLAEIRRLVSSAE